MKKIFALALLSLVTLAASAGVTNVTVKCTVEIAGTGTNSATLTIQQDGSNKDAVLVDALVWYHAQAVAGGVYTNTFHNWLKDETKARFQTHVPEKAANDFAVTAQKVNTILTTQPDLLSQTQKNQLAAIAALLP